MKKISDISNWEEMKNQIMHADCLEVMRKMPNNCIDLIITDPPYGIDIAKRGEVGGGSLVSTTKFSKKKWDNEIPSKEIFSEIFRVSKNQIIFGGNYFIEHLKNTSSFIVWDKNNGESYFVDCEIAWTSHKKAIRKFKYTWDGFRQENMKNKEKRQHPTQKPLELGRWCIENYTTEEERAKDGFTIFDPFGGSFTFARACKDFNIDFISCDMEEEYCDIGEKRMRQQNLF